MRLPETIKALLTSSVDRSVIYTKRTSGWRDYKEHHRRRDDDQAPGSFWPLGGNWRHRILFLDWPTPVGEVDSIAAAQAAESPAKRKTAVARICLLPLLLL